MDKKKTISLMREFISVKEKEVVVDSSSTPNMTFANLRDNIIGLGKILLEDFETNTYIVRVPSGVGNMNSAVVALHLEDNVLNFMAYAREGIIKQHTAEKAIRRVQNKLSKYIK